MEKLLFSFEKRNVRDSAGRWLFERREIMRFEWLALLAYKRLTSQGDQAWVDSDEITTLPSWGGKSRHHIATNVGRYLRSGSVLSRYALVTSRTVWTGPYRLNTDPLSVEFDISLSDVRKRLHLLPRPASTTRREDLIRFTFSYVRAQWLYFRGRLPPARVTKRLGDNAYDRLMKLSRNHRYGTTLRLLACLSAVDVLYRLGRYALARQKLVQNKSLLRHTPDLSLRARYYLKLAWADQRASTGKNSDKAVEAALRYASAYAENSGDRDSLGLMAHRLGGYLTKKERFKEAVNQYTLALEAYLITGNYDMVQATCGNLGSAMHRMGLTYYPEVRRWLLLSITVARWMKLGRDDAHSEMILAKMYAESLDSEKSYWLLKRAERIATHAGNEVNLADVHMMWGLWHQYYGEQKDEIAAVVKALGIFRNLPEFDVPQKEKYMEHKFSKVWTEVQLRAEKPWVVREPGTGE